MLHFLCKKEEKTNFLFFGFVFFLWLSMACQAMNFNVPVVSALCVTICHFNFNPTYQAIALI